MSDSAIPQQKRRRSVAMSEVELDQYLATQLTCRLATNSVDGPPHQSPLYFVWNDGVLWTSSLVRSQRWKDIERDPAVSVLVDSGDFYGELRGVEIHGVAVQVGEVPRVGEPNPQLEAIEAMMTAKYNQGLSAHDGRHAWLQIKPTKLISWDFRKLEAQSSR
jgi:hypothetical protein